MFSNLGHRLLRLLPFAAVATGTWSPLYLSISIFLSYYRELDPHEGCSFSLLQMNKFEATITTVPRRRLLSIRNKLQRNFLLFFPIIDIETIIIIDLQVSVTQKHNKRRWKSHLFVIYVVQRGSRATHLFVLLLLLLFTEEFINFPREKKELSSEWSYRGGGCNEDVPSQ